MTVKTVTYWGTLMNLARAEADARLNGTPEEYEQAKVKHEEYRQLCLSSDEMNLQVYRGEVY